MHNSEWHVAARGEPLGTGLKTLHRFLFTILFHDPQGS